MIDKSGKLFKRVSIIDIIIVVAIVALAVGFAYRQTSDQLQIIINPSDVFYVTIEANRTREMLIDAVSEGDYMFRLHEQQPLGRVIAIDTRPATYIIRRTDGVAVVAEMEGRVNLIITLEAVGSITDRGYFVNGNDHLAPGSDIVLVSNRVLLGSAWVSDISTERP